MITLKNIAAYAIWTGATALFLINPVQAGIPIEHWAQASGAQVYLVQSHGIPMLDLQIDFDAGSRRDPADQAGLASVTARMSSKGVRAGAAHVTGAGAVEPALDENALSEAWADLGASFHAGASSDRMSFSLRSLSYPELLGKAVQLAARQLGEPAFPEAIWQRERETLNAAIKEANTRPATLANRAFEKAVYGQHPYGFEMTEATLARISVSDMKSLHARLIAPCRAKVTLVGAVNRAQADALVTQLLARLPTAHAPCPALPTVAEVVPLDQPVATQISFDSAQAHVLIGQPGFTRQDSDYFALTVGNYILGGGGFVSRLTNEVREKRGLSYSVYSYFAPGLHAGAFTLGLQTRPDQAEQAVQVSRDVLRRFVADGPTEAELQAAKDNLIGGFALRIDSNGKLLGNVANIAWHGLALDYLETWTQQVAKVTAQDIKAAFQRKLQPDKMVTVVLGGVNTGQ
ncbi:pitrilysin family protein [Rhodoferax sp.]|uniref:M16 family metallopeptidase n=1 Tax=Rhodoferax sp. TaxID=50421 RepID=UPI0025CF2791|nr:pitrilysin family protein [Rhodoferax sp.]